MSTWESKFPLGCLCCICRFFWRDKESNFLIHSAQIYKLAWVYQSQHIKVEYRCNFSRAVQPFLAKQCPQLSIDCLLSSGILWYFISLCFSSPADGSPLFHDVAVINPEFVTYIRIKKNEDRIWVLSWLVETQMFCALFNASKISALAAS